MLSVCNILVTGTLFLWLLLLGAIVVCFWLLRHFNLDIFDWLTN